MSFLCVVFFIERFESLWKLGTIFPFLPHDATIHAVIHIMNLRITVDSYSIITSRSSPPSFHPSHSPVNWNSGVCTKSFHLPIVTRGLYSRLPGLQLWRCLRVPTSPLQRYVGALLLPSPHQHHTLSHCNCSHTHGLYTL